MTLGSFNVPLPVNEPVSGFTPGSPERSSLEARLDSMASEVIEIPVVINGEEHRTGNTIDALIPHDHGHVLARAHQATPELIERLRDAIPPIHYPQYEAAAEAAWLRDDDQVLGYAVGDQALIEVARILEKHRREADTCCRYGGEEFALC